jgi:hypothetical protein
VRVFRRLLPRLQVARCAGCDLVVRERRRKPCPRCGTLGRIHERGWSEGTSAQDVMG